jgi:hypothetical protein
MSSNSHISSKIALAAGAFGLSRRSWIVTSELNLTVWPGPDLRPARAPAGAWWRYGRLSHALRLRLAAGVRALIAAGAGGVVSRE